jgi:hypothetical protein
MQNAATPDIHFASDWRQVMEPSYVTQVVKFLTSGLKVRTPFTLTETSRHVSGSFHVFAAHSMLSSNQYNATLSELLTET